MSILDPIEGNITILDELSVRPGSRFPDVQTIYPTDAINKLVIASDENYLIDSIGHITVINGIAMILAKSLKIHLFQPIDS